LFVLLLILVLRLRNSAIPLHFSVWHRFCFHGVSIRRGRIIFGALGRGSPRNFILHVCLGARSA
jgi:hypothetical protein